MGQVWSFSLCYVNVYLQPSPASVHIPDVVAGEKFAIHAGENVVIPLLLSVDLGADVLLRRLRDGRNIVRRKEVRIEGIVEETVVKTRVGQYVVLGFTVAAKQLRIELAAILICEPVDAVKIKRSTKVAQVCACMSTKPQFNERAKMRLTVRVTCSQARLLLADGRQCVYWLETKRRLGEGLRGSAAR